MTDEERHEYPEQLWQEMQAYNRAYFKAEARTLAQEQEEWDEWWRQLRSEHSV